MSLVPSPRLLLPLGLALLAACAQQKTGPVVVQDQQDDCPLSLSQGQPLVLTLPSNPTTGFRWVMRDAASNVLQSLGPEVYSTPEDAGLVGDEKARAEAEQEEGQRTLEGWLRLAHAYGVLRENEARRAALERAVTLAPDRSDIQLALAEAEADAGAADAAAGRLKSLLERLPAGAPERAAAEAELNRLGDRD